MEVRLGLPSVVAARGSRMWWRSGGASDRARSVVGAMMADRVYWFAQAESFYCCRICAGWCVDRDGLFGVATRGMSTAGCFSSGYINCEEAAEKRSNTQTINRKPDAV